MQSLKTAMMTSISEVLETMFFMSLDFDIHATLENSDIMHNDLSMACRLNFTGPFSGCLLIIVPKDLLAHMTESFMGLEQDKITAQHREGTIKELANMIAGNTFSTLNNQIEFKLAIPELIDTRTVSDQYLPTKERDVEIITETTGGLWGAKIILNDVHPND
ncbi:MAG: chemotaxis protein CheX [Desulfobacteraceae bacterium]|nr:MAG: chemotaxis protein CheX [Desulfobacteraceae bacterium]